MTDLVESVSESEASDASTDDDNVVVGSQFTMAKTQFIASIHAFVEESLATFFFATMKL